MKTKGGTTEAGLKILEQEDFSTIFNDAIEAANKCAKELERNIKHLELDESNGRRKRNNRNNS